MENQSSFILLYKTYAAPLYGVILGWVNNEEEAREILEETFTHAWQSRDLLPTHKLKPFSQLHLIAKRLSKRYLVN
ncbi:DNA-directed RNA polymerase specialized sigma24 family protein [Pedobacter sp. UYEF25]